MIRHIISNYHLRSHSAILSAFFLFPIRSCKDFGLYFVVQSSLSYTYKMPQKRTQFAFVALYLLPDIFGLDGVCLDAKLSV
jgi:hypothetical protein